MAASITVFVPSTQTFCAGFRAHGSVFRTLYDLADEASPEVRVQCWRKLEALLRDLQPTLPDPDVHIGIPRGASLEDLCDAHIAERGSCTLQSRWLHHWNVDDIDPEVRTFAFRAVTVLTEAYRKTHALRRAS